MTETVREIEEEMLAAANNLEFEKAALLRDQVRELKRMTGDASGSAKAAPVNYWKGKGRKVRQGR